MPLRYRPQKVVKKDQLRALAEAEVPEGMEGFRDQVIAILDAILDNVNLEFGRVGTAVNGAGGQSTAQRTVTASSDLTSVDGTVFGDTTAGAVTLTLPPADEYPGLVLVVKRSAGANTLTVAPSAGDTINGGGSVSVTSATSFQSLGTTDWQTL
jgi:hypothetical protein